MKALKLASAELAPKLEVHLNLAIDSDAELATLVPKNATELILDCSGVKRITSAGIRAWVSFFRGLADSGVKLHFVACSPAIVESLNLIHDFLCGGHLVSINLPFFCGNCKNETVRTYTLDELKQKTSRIDEIPCRHCGSSAEFDESPSEYLGFLFRAR